MQKKNAIIFVESNTSGTGKLFIKEAIANNLSVFFMTCNPQLYGDLDNVYLIVVDTQDENKIYQECVKVSENGFNITGILTSSEYYVYVVSHLAQRLKLPGANPEAIKICQNKYCQRIQQEKNGLDIPKYYMISSPQELDSIIHQISFPIVVKPVQGSGSVGVKLCYAETIHSHIQNLFECSTNERGVPVIKGVLLEEYIEGEEYSVETFNDIIIGITKKHLSNPPYFVETGHDFPASLSDELKNSIAEIIKKVISLSGLAWGANHIEVKIKDNRVYVIEVNPRLAGGFIPKLVLEAMGINLIKNMVCLATSRHISINPIKDNTYSIRFICNDKAGYLDSITGIEKLVKLVGCNNVQIYRKKGDYMTGNYDFRNRIGHVIFRTEIIEEVEECLREIQVTVSEVI